MRPESVVLDEHAQILCGSASRLALLWQIVMDAERSGRPAPNERREIATLLKQITRTGRAIQEALAGENAPPAYAAPDLRRPR